MHFHLYVLQIKGISYNFYQKCPLLERVCVQLLSNFIKQIAKKYCITMTLEGDLHSQHDREKELKEISRIPLNCEMHSNITGVKLKQMKRDVSHTVERHKISKCKSIIYI